MQQPPDEDAPLRDAAALAARLARAHAEGAALGEPAPDGRTFRDAAREPGQAAPERAAGAPPSRASDLYGLGVWLYTAIAGSGPFAAPTPLQTRLRALEGRYTPLGPRVPPELEALIDALLARDPDRRPGDAAAVAEALRGWAGLPPPGRAPSLPAPAEAPEPSLAPAAPPPEASVPPAPAPPPPPPEDRARYAWLAEIGAGGLGRVWAARDERLGRTVAVKELRADQPAARTRFLREAKVTADLQHPGIVPVYDVGCWPDTAPFYTMRRVEGQTLEEVIDAASDLDARLALLPRALAAADAVAFAHARGVVHRDLKPANVLVGGYGETVVIDWGLATAPAAAPAGEGEAAASVARGLTLAGSVLGTPGYMPPEQARGEPVDARADVYALGAILYHMLAGVPPHTGPDTIAALEAVLAGPPPPLDAVEPATPRDLLALVGKAMERDPGRRYPDAGALAHDLRAFLSGRLVSAHVYTLRDHLRRFAARNRAPLAVATLALLGLAVGGVQAVRAVDAERRVAIRRADELAWRSARELVFVDPQQALDRLAGLTEAFPAWGGARQLAAHALAQPEPTTWADARTQITGRPSAMVSDDGQVVAWRGVDVVHVLDLRTERRGAVPVRTTALDLTRDGARLAVHDGTQVSAWDVPCLLDHGDACRLGELGVSSAPRGLTWSPTGESLTVMPRQGGLVRWSPGSGAQEELVCGQGETTAVAWAGPALHTITRSGHYGRWAPDAPPLCVRASDDALMRLWVSPAGDRVLVAGNDGFLRGLEAATGEPFLTPWLTLPAMAWDLAWEPDGQRAWLTMLDTRLHQLNLGDGSHREVDLGLGPLQGVELQPTTGALVVGTRAGGITQIDPVTSVASVFAGHRGGVGDLVVPGSGGQIVTIGMDGQLRVWRLPRAELAQYTVDAPPEDHHHPPVLAAAAPGGGWLLSRGGSVERVDDQGATTFAWPAGGEVYALAPWHDGAVWVTRDGALWRGDAGAAPQHLGGLGGPALQLLAAPALDRLVVAGPGPDARVWRGDGATVAEVRATEAGVGAVDLSPSGRQLVIGGRDGSVTLADLEAGASRALTPHTWWVNSARFLDETSVLTLGGDSTMLRHDVVAGTAQRTSTLITWERLTRLPGEEWLVADGIGNLRVVGREGEAAYWLGHRHIISALAVSPDGSRVASASMDNTLRVWDVATGFGRPLIGHRAAVRGACWSEDGRRLLSWSADGSARLWADDLPSTPGELKEIVRQRIARASVVR